MNPLLLALSSQAGAVLVAGLWQGSVLALATALFLRCVPRASAELRFLLWTATLGLSACLPLLENLRVVPSYWGWAGSRGSVLHADGRWGLALCGVWLACTLLRAGSLVGDAWRLRGIRQGATPVPISEGLRDLLLSQGREVEIRQAASIERPGVAGFLSPCILLPLGLADKLSATELAQVVLHEMEHLRRRDDWFNLLQKLCLVLLPLNPALLWIDRRLCFERELACDEAVVRRLRAPRSYALLLAKLAEQSLERRTVSLILGAMERPSQLARRVYRILEERTTASRWERCLVACGLAIGLTAGSVGLALCPELVGFSGSPAAAAMSASNLAAATPHVIYRETGAGLPAIVQASLRSTVRPAASKRHTLRVRHVAKPKMADPVRSVVTANLAEPVDSLAERPLPLLVGYRLVQVDGGWLLLQL